ncbi:MAG: elongation factor P [Acidobacteria bacterium]|nr:MAG: elongation factor P [Acidobacteriota bacterium]REK03930.1 MAG: elongation factor P [Acidobacteriota bacterium]REK15092.1 MAG: elongation factor P [Acidobacteriota bacterium]REK46182.1 MAG: elongation factor P [Acidobacteriota bacterium]
MGKSANDLRRGNIIILDGTPCKVMEFDRNQPGKGGAIVNTKLRNLVTGNSFEHRFRSNESVERAILDQHEMEYLYSDGEMHHFMNTENYEQIAMSNDDLGDAAKWLMAGLKIQVEFFENDPIGVELPQSLELTITETEPVMKGATASNSNKPATLENGVTLYVPPYMTEGERIRVNPSEEKYIERVK